MRPYLKGRKRPIPHGFMPGGIKGIPFQIRPQTILHTRTGHVRLTIEQVIGSTVVFGMRVLPGKVGDEEELVQHKADDIIPGLARGKRAVTTFVGQDPGTGHDGAHPKGVGGPAGEPSKDSERFVVIGKFGGEDEGRRVDQTGGHGEVTKDVEEAPHVGSLEAVSRNDGFDLSFGGKFRSIFS